MKSSRHIQCALASAALLAALCLNADAAPRASVVARATERVSIQTYVGGRFAAVQPDGTVIAQGTAMGIAGQFELATLSGDLVALKSLSNGKYVSARGSAPLIAAANSIGPFEVFQRAGGRRGLARLRAVGAKDFVCARDEDGGVLEIVRRCAHDAELLRIARVETPAFTIVSPVPGSVLRTRTVTFQWQAGGDEYWLNIGTAPGQSDIYASSSLGIATEHAVTGLPLNGVPLFVEVRRRIGTLVESAKVQYTAPIRKGLLIITDFADRRLEDWTGSGMKTVDDVSVQLRKMEDHWAWLSRGRETIRWEIIRVQLPQPALPGVFPSWPAFREAVITLAKTQVRTDDYDVNSDGVIDAAWLIVSSGDIPIDYAIGGTSRNAGANLFVDGQASRSVISGATGNFNHELGHCLGLPDLYGPYDTLHTLTDMSFSWDVPPPDFTAYERIKLGWLKPQVIDETSTGVWLPSSDVMAAVMVPSNRANEYFLIEYRQRPATGYGSINPPFNGLAVYHVLEDSSMSQDPPIVKLEPADGSIEPGNHAIDVNDFASPANPAFVQPMALSSYYGDDQEIFRIDNVVWRDGGIAFDITLANQQASAANLLANGSFESGQANRPGSWTPGSWVAMPNGFVWPSAVASDGQVSAQLVSTGNDMWWAQSVAVTPGKNYKVCGSLKGEDIRGGGTGGNVSLLGGWIASESLLGTFEWTTKCFLFTAQAPSVDVACRLGFYASVVSGKLWCDNVTLEHLRSAFTDGVEPQ